jgi:hypothetical protein
LLGLVFNDINIGGIFVTLKIITEVSTVGVAVLFVKFTSTPTLTLLCVVAITYTPIEPVEFFGTYTLIGLLPAGGGEPRQ